MRWKEKSDEGGEGCSGHLASSSSWARGLLRMEIDGAGNREGEGERAEAAKEGKTSVED